MIEIINSLISNNNTPIVASFLLGILMAISPCPLASNIAAIAYISKRANNIRVVLLDGIFYTLGRLFSYTLVASLIYFGLSGFKIAKFLQTWGDKIIGPILLIIGFSMLGLIKINIRIIKSNYFEGLKEKLAKSGYLGSFLLGIILALAFCPYSGVLFFAILIPMILSLKEGLLLAPIFAIGTGLPVILFSFIIAFSFQKLGKYFNAIKKIEKIIRYSTAFIFIIIGIYYTYFLFKYLINL